MLNSTVWYYACFDWLREHVLECAQHGKPHIILPKVSSGINYKKMMLKPFFDLETRVN